MLLWKLRYGIKGSPRALYRCFNTSLSDDHLKLQETCRKFTESELKPFAAQHDQNGQFPSEQISKLGKLGLLSINVSPKWGGSGMDKLSLAVAVEEISRGCGGTGAITSIHNALYTNLIDKCGNDQQKEKFLKPFTSGTLGCFALSESEAGSDVASMATTAVKEGECFVINGCKTWITSGLQAKAAIIFATIDKNLKHKGITAFLVPIPSPGLLLGKNEDKLGIRATSTCNLTLENVLVPKENILGDVGGGFKLAMIQLNEARIGIGAQALGIAQAALEVAILYASQRKTFGQFINRHQAVKLRIAEMALRLESARLLVRNAAVLCEQVGDPTKYCAMAKLAASETATFVTHNALQILGGMGYVRDMPVERLYRDARVTEIYGGVSDIQRLLIAEAIIKEFN